MKKKRPSRKSRRSHRAYRRNPARTVADPHGARELALCYDNERQNQAQKESIINNLARKMAKGKYDKAQAVKLWGYAAKAGADVYAKQFGSHGDTGAKMFNAATRAMAASIMEDENRDYVKERSERFAPKKVKRNPSPKRASSKKMSRAMLLRVRARLIKAYSAKTTTAAKRAMILGRIRKVEKRL